MSDSLHNVDAEEQVLGSLLTYEPAAKQVVEDVGLDSSDFYLDRHRATYETLAALYRAGKPIDTLITVEALREAGTLDQAGGANAIAQLAEQVNAPGNALHHATIVRERSLQAEVAELGAEIQQLATDAPVDGAVSELTAKIDLVTQRSAAGQIRTVKGSEIRLRRVEFMDAAGMIPTRSVIVIVGAAGLGKTRYLCQMAASVTRGQMAGLTGPRNVLISSQEDDAEAVLAPSMVAAGADLDRVHFVQGLSLPSEVPALSARAKAIDAALVGIGPIAAHLDNSVDSHKDAGIRAAIAPLAEMASELELAVLIVAHPNKDRGKSGLDRISGSGGLGNAARSVIVFGTDPGDPDGEAGSRRIIAHLKCNVGKRAPSLAAEIVLAEVQTEDGIAQVPRLSITGKSDHFAEDVLGSPDREERTERDEARSFLEQLLVGGPVKTTEIRRQAEDAELSWRTIERAKQDLKIKATQGPDGWHWHTAESS